VYSALACLKNYSKPDFGTCLFIYNVVLADIRSAAITSFIANLTINQYGFGRYFLKYFQDSIGQNVGQIGGYGIGIAEDVVSLPNAEQILIENA
jgi:hypothetical protein